MGRGCFWLDTRLIFRKNTGARQSTFTSSDLEAQVDQVVELGLGSARSDVLDIVWGDMVSCGTGP